MKNTAMEHGWKVYKYNKKYEVIRKAPEISLKGSFVYSLTSFFYYNADGVISFKSSTSTDSSSSM